jgi:uncharacterized iron-regulated membrane protein
MKRSLGSVLLLIALTLPVTGVYGASTEQTAAKPAVAKEAKQPHMEAAQNQLNKAKAQLGAAQPAAKPDKAVLEMLRKAKAQLDQAADNKGGHKAKAIDLVKQAVKAASNADALKAVDLALLEVKQGMEAASAKKK